MSKAANLLVQPGDPRWDRLGAEKRSLLSARNGTVEDRLRRGQALASQAVQLRRAVHDDRARPA